MWPFVSKPVRHLKSLTRQLKSERDAATCLKIVDSISDTAGETAGKNSHIFGKAIHALMEAAKHPDRAVRLSAIRSLSRLAPNDEAIYETLAILIQDNDPEVQNQVTAALVDGHHYPSMLQALHYSPGEAKVDLAVRIAACFYSDIRKLRDLDRWLKGQNSDRGVAPPANQTREDLMFERFTLQETLKVYSTHFINQLQKTRSMHLIREVMVHLLNLWDNHPWDQAVETLAADFMQGKPEAFSAFQELLNAATPEPVLGRYGKVSQINAPLCRTCNKELELFHFAIRDPHSNGGPTIVYSGIVCKECKKIQCSDCKGKPNFSPCIWCGAEVAPAYSKYL